MILVPTRIDPLQDSRLARRLRRPRLLATGHHDCPPTGQDDCRHPGAGHSVDEVLADYPLRHMASESEEGALIIVDPSRMRVRVLPVQRI